LPSVGGGARVSPLPPRGSLAALGARVTPRRPRVPARAVGHALTWIPEEALALAARAGAARSRGDDRGTRAVDTREPWHRLGLAPRVHAIAEWRRTSVRTCAREVGTEKDATGNVVLSGRWS
jgi:hypothetical protein